MSDKFLNYTGLSYYHDRISNVFATQTDVESALDDKVDKVTGKGLSTNDYTTAEQSKLSNIASGAQVNVIETVKKNGTALTVTSKAVDISVPTKTSDLTNDSGFITSADVPEGAAASTTTPKMDGTAAVGTETAFARGDHVHPSDTTKVDKVSGKGLSTNDYTTTEKNKLSNISSGAQVNVIETVKVNGTALSVSSKAVDVTVPTKTSDITNDSGFITSAALPTKTSDLTNDSNFVVDANYSHITVDSALSSSSTNPLQNKAINTALGLKAPLASPSLTGTPTAPTAAAGTNTTQIATTAFVSTAIANGIAGITQISYQVVTSLPASGSNGVIYLVSHSHGTQDVYDEYIWTGSSFEKLGNTDIDLSGYMLTTDMVAITTSEIDALFA